MSESRKTPPLGSKKFSRSSSEGVARLHESASRSSQGEFVRDLVDDEITGQYEGEDLEIRRALRPPDTRIARHEKKHDELKQDAREKHDELKQDVREKHDELKHDVAEMRTDVKGLSGQVSDLRAGVSGAVGKLDGQEKVLGEMLSIVKKTADRDHVTFTAKLEVDKERELARVDVDKELQLDKVDARRARRKVLRKLILKGLGLVGGGGVVVELLHRLGVL